MADDKLNGNPALPQDGDDTVTRKTIKLRPAMMPGAQTVRPAAPRPAANTDTGSIDLADDTQTRRTIKLKPVAPIVSAKPPTPAAPAAAPADAASAAPQADGDDTVTRKTIKLKPMASPGMPASSTSASAAPAAEESGEKTIRIQRPPKPVTGPATSPRPVPATPAAGGKPSPQPQSVKLPTFQKPPAAPNVKPPLAAAPKGTSSSEPLEDYFGEESDVASAPSKACLIMTIIALICMIYSTLLITVQFLDITQRQNTADAVSFMVPGIK